MNPPRKSVFVQRIVNGVSRPRLENAVRSLAAFPTRHTLSGERGADAAALWIERELKSYGGRLSVELDRINLSFHFQEIVEAFVFR